MKNPPAAVVVLAAGAGTRMKSRTPKVLHTVAGRTLLGHAISAGQALHPDRLVVVVRHERDGVVNATLAVDSTVLIADQDEIPGTGRAVQCALERLADEGIALDRPVVVTAADTPLLDGDTLIRLVEQHERGGFAVTMLTAHVANPTGYGRVVRNGDQVVGVVEEKDATEEQRAITEINAGVYVFEPNTLVEALGGVGRENAQGELYLTDVVGLAHRSGKSMSALPVEDSWTVEGCNDKVQLASLAKEMNRRIVEKWMRAGVTVIDPATTWIDVDVELSPDVTIEPGVQLRGACRVEAGATIGPDSTLTDVEVGEGASVVRTHGSLAVIGAGAKVGPFSFLRPGAYLGAHSKIGAFVEVKNSTVGKGSSVPHLSYVGDADIGEGTNIGAASVFANYDGVNKHRSIVGDHCRTGSDNMFVAPVHIGDGAYTGAGTTLRRDVPPGALAVNPTAQRNIEGWVLRTRPGTAAAEAAARALGIDSDGVAAPEGE